MIVSGSLPTPYRSGVRFQALTQRGERTQSGGQERPLFTLIRAKNTFSWCPRNRAQLNDPATPAHLDRAQRAVHA